MNTNLKNMIKEFIPSRLITYKLKANSKKCVLFTFDDGPDARYTPEILDLLDLWNCKAIFFVVGKRAVKEPDILNLIVKKGHRIGNHTHNHHINIKLKYLQYKKDISDCDNFILDITGIRSPYIRFPGGHLSIQGMCAALALKLKIIMWSSEGGEWGGRSNLTKDQIARCLIDEITPQDIIMLHDDNEKIPYVLKNILPVLSRKGFDLHSGIDYI